MLPPDLARIEPLAPSDAPRNVALSRSVGWQDVEAEWRVLYEAAHVIGVRDERGGLLAQCAIGVYGAQASIAKMVISPEAQGGGWGRLMLDHVLEHARSAGVTTCGLVATPQGEALYRSRGFSPTSEVVIMTGAAPEALPVAPELTALHDLEEAVALDRAWTSCDRSRMLRARYGEACASAALSGGGFAMASLQGDTAIIGPVQAESKATAQALSCGIFAQLGGRQVRIDVPAEQLTFRAWLANHGFQERAVRSEMARGGARVPWQVPQRFALATQAWG
jgi:GNAT superfamily N-acetyltransferase